MGAPLFEIKTESGRVPQVEILVLIVAAYLNRKFSNYYIGDDSSPTSLTCSYYELLLSEEINVYLKSASDNEFVYRCKLSIKGGEVFSSLDLELVSIAQLGDVTAIADIHPDIRHQAQGHIDSLMIPLVPGELPINLGITGNEFNPKLKINPDHWELETQIKSLLSNHEVQKLVPSGVDPYAYRIIDRHNLVLAYMLVPGDRVVRVTLYLSEEGEVSYDPTVCWMDRSQVYDQDLKTIHSES